MNLNEQTYRIKQMMGIISEKIDIPQDSYITMNVKNFPKFQEEIKQLLKDRLVNSNGNFNNFKNSVVIGYDNNKTPIISDDLQALNNRYLNYMVSMGAKKVNDLLYKIFTEYQGIDQSNTKNISQKINCDPTNFKILGPIVAKDEKSLLSYWINQKGGKVYIIVFPDECKNQLGFNEHKTYVTVEPIENRIHFPKGVTEKLRGKGLGALIYLSMIKKLGYITSSMGNSPEIKAVYQDIISNPKYEKELMSLLLQKQILIIDRNTNQNVNKIFNDFVSNKFTDKKSVQISPELKKILGQDFDIWYNSLDANSEKNIDDKIKKYEGQEPKGGDTVVDTTTGRIYSFNGEWEDNGKKLIQLISNEYETLLLPSDQKKRFKIIHQNQN